MLTEPELTSMRATASSALPGTCVISLGGTLVSDGGGGGSISYTSGGTVDCRIAPMNADEREIGERIAADAEYIVTLPHNANVTTDAKLVIGGTTYNVAAIRDRSWHTSTRVEVVKEV